MEEAPDITEMSIQIQGNQLAIDLTQFDFRIDQERFE
jgi:hypothetical protein